MTKRRVGEPLSSLVAAEVVRARRGVPEGPDTWAIAEVNATRPEVSTQGDRLNFHELRDNLVRSPKVGQCCDEVAASSPLRHLIMRQLISTVAWLVA